MGNLTLRDLVSSSKILKVLATVGVRLPIGHLKAFLKELGFAYNGNSCTMQEFLRKVKEYADPQPVVVDEPTGVEP